MGEIREPAAALRIVAVISRHEPAIGWARETAEEAWGPVALQSPPFDFTETDYYQSTMGTDLKKVFIAFRQLIDPAELAAMKCQTNRWEVEYARRSAHEEPRPLNLDPGYMTEAKLVLASTKDHAHRVYLSNGIYAEVTLRYRSDRWQKTDWTYPDYLRNDYHQFFNQCRNHLRRPPV